MMTILDPWTLALLLVIAICVWQGGCLTMHTAQYFRGRPLSYRTIFAGLKQKLVMTASLGLFFIALYMLVVTCAAYFLGANEKHKLFEYAREHSIACIYGGLALFVTISIVILGIRKIIKNIYNAQS